MKDHVWVLPERTRGSSITMGSQESSRGEGLEEAGVYRYVGINQGQGRGEGTRSQAKTREEVGNRTRDWKGNRVAASGSKPEAGELGRGGISHRSHRPHRPECGVRSLVYNTSLALAGMETVVGRRSEYSDLHLEKMPLPVVIPWRRPRTRCEV